MPLNDYEDAQFINNTIPEYRDNAGVVTQQQSKIGRDLLVATGYGGTGNNLVTPDAELMACHIIIYDGLPVDKAIPIQITIATSFEGVIGSQFQYLNPPARPDYSKETFDKLIEIVSTNPNVWTMGTDEANAFTVR